MTPVVCTRGAKCGMGAVYCQAVPCGRVLPDPTVTRLEDFGPFRRYEMVDGDRSCVVFFDMRGGGPHVEVVSFIGNRASPSTWPKLFESGRFRGDTWSSVTEAGRALFVAADERGVTP